MPQHSGDGSRDDSFSFDESLYRRYRLDEVEGGHPIAATLDFPGTSVNRERYSDEVKDVLHPDCCNGKEPVETGVLVTTVRLVEDGSVEISGNGRRFVLFVCHEPKPTCRAHSEIWCREEGAQEPPKNTPRTVRYAFRAALALKFTVLIAASA